MLRQGGLFAPISREGALVFNNLFLTTACATVFVGTLYPLALEALTGDKISVGPPFFNATFGPLFASLLVAVPFGPLLAWKRGDLGGRRPAPLRRLRGGVDRHCGDLRARRPSVLAPFGIGLALFVIAGAMTDIVERTGLLRTPLSTWCAALAGCRARPGAPRSPISALASRLLGIVGETQWGAERIVSLKPGEKIAHPQLRPHLRPYRQSHGPNYTELAAVFTVRRHGEVVGVLEPSKRTFVGARHRHDGIGPDGARREPALSVARRHQPGRLGRRSGSITSRWCC